MYHVLINPASQSKKGASVWPGIRDVLESSALPYRVYETTHKGHDRELAARISQTDPSSTLIVLGGDGSINNVLNGLRHLDTMTLGLIPGGSGNDFASGMGIPSDPREALSVILKGTHVTQMDVGRLRFEDGSTCRFGISAGLGFDAAVCHEVDHSALKSILNRLGIGKAVYSVIAVKQIAAYKPCSLQITTDDGTSLEIPDVYFTALMNQRFEGGGLMLTPDARPDDGFLDLLVCGGIGRLTLVKTLPAAKHGGHVHLPGLRFLRCRSVTLTAAGPCPVHTDGEPNGIRASLTADLEPQKLKVLTGKPRS